MVDAMLKRRAVLWIVLSAIVVLGILVLLASELHARQEDERYIRTLSMLDGSALMLRLAGDGAFDRRLRAVEIEGALAGVTSFRGADIACDLNAHGAPVACHLVD